MNENDIINDYKNGVSILSLRIKYKLGFNTIKKILIINNIKIRNASEAGYARGYKVTDEMKKNLSEKRKKWLSNNPDKHPWKNKEKFISKPCEFFKKKLKENEINFLEEKNPIENRAYSIDIVIIDKMIGFEINGNQHYNSDKTLKEYYRKRKEEIEKLGWKLYDIYYTKVFDEKFIKEIVEFIKEQKEIPNLNFNFKEKIINYCVCGKKISNNSKKCKKCAAFQKRKIENRPDKEILLKEVKEMGYCATGRKYGVSDNSIRKWLK